MMKDKKVRVYQNEKLEEEVPAGVLVEYANPRLFVKPKYTVDFFISDSKQVIDSYAKTDVERIYSLREALGEYGEENPVDDTSSNATPAGDTPVQENSDGASVEDQTENFVEQKETDHLTHEEIRAANFFTQKKMVKEKYGESCKNKDEIEAVLQANE